MGSNSAAQEPATCPFLPKMAPNFAESQHAQICDMILNERPPVEIADVAGCSMRAI